MEVLDVVLDTAIMHDSGGGGLVRYQNDGLNDAVLGVGNETAICGTVLFVGRPADGTAGAFGGIEAVALCDAATARPRGYR